MMQTNKQYKTNKQTNTHIANIKSESSSSQMKFGILVFWKFSVEENFRIRTNMLDMIPWSNVRESLCTTKGCGNLYNTKKQGKFFNHLYGEEVVWKLYKFDFSKKYMYNIERAFVL